VAAGRDHYLPPGHRAIFGVRLFEADNGVRDALHLLVAAGGRQVVEQHHGAVAAREELLQRQDLPAIAQRPAGQQAQFRQRVEHDPPRRQLLDVAQDALRGFAQFHLGRMEHRVLLFRLQGVRRRYHLPHVHAAEVPAVRLGDAGQFRAGFRQGHVEHPLALARAFHQELQRDRGLARTGCAFHDIEAVAGESAGEYVVQAVDAGTQNVQSLWLGSRHEFSRSGFDTALCRWPGPATRTVG